MARIHGLPTSPEKLGQMTNEHVLPLVARDSTQGTFRQLDQTSAAYPDDLFGDAT